jgi:hypothetical protein
MTFVPIPWASRTSHSGVPSAETSTGTRSASVTSTWARANSSVRGGGGAPCSPSTPGRRSARNEGNGGIVRWLTSGGMSVGISRSTPNGRSVMRRTAAISWRSSSGVRKVAPSTPKPPAFDTAAVRGARVTPPIPAAKIEQSIPSKSQIGVRNLIGSSSVVAGTSTISASNGMNHVWQRTLNARLRQVRKF